MPDPNPHLKALHDAGVSIWLDTLSRELLESGEFSELVRDYSVTGATSNPTIFAKAITGSDHYVGQLRAAVAAGITDTRELFFEIALEDVRRAAAVLRPTYQATGGPDGFVSFECTPDLADDTEATSPRRASLAAPRRAERDDQGPGHRGRRAGDRGADRRRRERQRHVAVLGRALRAGHRGLSERARTPRRGRAPIDGIASVASFFVSRVDAKAHAVLPLDSPLRGEVA